MSDFRRRLMMMITMAIQRLTQPWIRSEGWFRSEPW